MTIIHLPERKPATSKKPSGSKGKVLRFHVPYLPPREGLTLAKPAPMPPYGTPSKKKPISDFERSYLALSPEERIEVLERVGKLQEAGLVPKE